MATLIEIIKNGNGLLDSVQTRLQTVLKNWDEENFTQADFTRIYDLLTDLLEVHGGWNEEKR